jgi:hypothetical protein
LERLRLVESHNQDLALQVSTVRALALGRRGVGKERRGWARIGRPSLSGRS